LDISELTFENFIRIWARIALVLIFVEAYLTINKIWIRKHEQVVSESVSVSAQFIALLTGAPFIALYITEGAYEGAIADSVFLIINFIMIAIGIGFWVEGRRSLGFWTNLRKSLRLEKNEANRLLTNFFKPVAANQVIKILHELANIDNELDEKEIEFIKSFADEWNIDISEVFDQPEITNDNAGKAFSRLRTLVQDYLRMSPPHEQAGHLRDVLSCLTTIDGNVSNEEEIIMEELGGLIDDYVSGNKNAGFGVFIAPQSRAQEVALQEIMQDHVKEQHLGGEVYVVGRYYSRAYADMVCSWYRDTGYLTINENFTQEENLA
jgi:hypothetical protein